MAALVDQNKTHDEIIQWFVTRYDSEEMLGAPLDTGFNRLAWLLPYVLGAGGILLVGFVAMKWSRPQAAPADTPAVADPALDERLDDELRNLD